MKMARCPGAWILRFAVVFFVFAGPAFAEAVPLRVVAANLTSGNHQAYSPDNGNHSNPEGAGARILKALKPDVVLVQEFNTTIPRRQWVNATFGAGFSFFVEEGAEIPNGIVSRYPIVACGEWDDPVLDNRDFAWAKIALPGGRFLWAISVHLYSRKPEARESEAAALLGKIRETIPQADLVVMGGDFNTKNRGEACVERLRAYFDAGKVPPGDSFGDSDTNAPRSRPYDWVLADADLARLAVPTRIGGRTFENGLVFDSRVFAPLDAVPPVRATDSGVPGMQHMAVARDFLLPSSDGKSTSD